SWYVQYQKYTYNHTSAERLQLIEFILWIRIRKGNSLLERYYICRAINRTHQRCFQNRSFTSKRISESSWYNSIVSTTLSNYCLLLTIARHANNIQKLSNTC